jgi:transposase
MSLELDTRIIDMHAQGATRNQICAELHVGPNRVSRIQRYFQMHLELSSPSHPGRPKKVTDEILSFIDIRFIEEIAGEQSLRQ